MRWASIATVTSFRTALSRDDGHDLLVVPLNHGGDEGLLAWEILIERAGADAGYFRDAVGAGLLKTFADQNASSRFDQGVDGGA